MLIICSEVISYGVRPADIIDIKSVGKGVFVILKGIPRDAEDKRRAEIDAATERVLAVTLLTRRPKCQNGYNFSPETYRNETLQHVK